MPIQIEHLSKQYNKGKEKAIDDICASIPKGIFGLLGENGAGKSTLLKILATVLPIQEGQVKFDDISLKSDFVKIRNRLGYLPQNFEFFENLTVYEMLDYLALLKGIKERKEVILQLLEEFNLEEKKNVKINKLSGGMKQRLAIAQALMGNPQYIILDEPTVGLDPSERLRFRNIISKKSDECNVLISTHIISDVSMLCENIGIMSKGKLVYCGEVRTLLEMIEGKVYIDSIKVTEMIDKNKYKNIISVLRKKDNMEIRFISEEDISEVYQTVAPNLEDAYFYMTTIGKEEGHVKDCC